MRRAILNFFFLHSYENQSKFIWQNGLVEILMFSLVSRKFLAMRNITLYSVSLLEEIFLLLNTFYSFFCNIYQFLRKRLKKIKMEVPFLYMKFGLTIITIKCVKNLQKQNIQKNNLLKSVASIFAQQGRQCRLQCRQQLKIMSAKIIIAFHEIEKNQMANKK